MNELVIELKKKHLVIPKNESDFLNPVLREQEWIFAYKFMKLLNYRLKHQYEVFREKRR